MPPLDPKLYTVAWIAPLEIEARAALLMMDNTHDGYFPMARGDDHIFHAGDMCKHNIIIATLPPGTDRGTGSAAALASQVKKSFPNLWFGLLVGVAAGLPDLSRTPPRDIRLGDVLVALPRGEDAGLVAYELGKETKDGFQPLQQGRALANTETVIRSAIGSIKVKAPKDTQLFMKHYYEAVKDEGHDNGTFGDPGQENDTLHITGEDGLQTAAERSQRPITRRTCVWYGTLGSGEKLMENARIRDELRDKYDIIGLEMEAAGIMNRIPVGIIRGVCDYGDEHKKKGWQPYAAAMAAAYAKAVLEAITPAKISAVKEEKSEKEELIKKLEKNACLRSLSFQMIHARRDDIGTAYPGTCDWLFDTPEFRQWRDPAHRSTHNGVLWIKGRPGTGKSTLMKHAYLQYQSQSFRYNLIVAYFFNARGESLEKTSLGLLRSMVYQLLTADKSDELYQRFLPLLREKERFDPTTQREWRQSELQGFIRSVVKRPARPASRPLLFLVDALDECDQSDVRDVVFFLESLSVDASRAGTSLQICLSSRHYPSLQMEKVVKLVVESTEAHRKSIEKYIEGNLRIRDDAIKAKIAESAQGVFLSVVLIIYMLNNTYDEGHVAAMQKTLNKLPIDLGHMFSRVLDHDGDRAETLLMLQWVLLSRRPLTPFELFTAVAKITPASAALAERRIIASSKGLIEVRADRVQFIHSTVGDFLFRENGLQALDPALGPDPVVASHGQLWTHCQSCILQIDVAMGGVKSMNKVKEKNPFLGYAASHILYHAERALLHHPAKQESFGKPELSEKGFVSVPGSQTLSIGQWLWESDSWFHRWKLFLLATGSSSEREMLERESDMGLLDVLAWHGLPKLLSVKLSGYHPRTGEIVQALLVACSRANHEIVRILLDAGADVNGKSDRHGDPLQIAAYTGHQGIVRLLIDKGADINASGGQYGNALEAAAYIGHQEIVRLLIDKGADINAQSGVYGNALQAASFSGNQVIVRLLIDKGANINAQGGVYGNALQAASFSGNQEIVRLLIDEGADINASGGQYSNALAAAAYTGHQEIIRLLIDKGADINAQGSVYGNALAAAAYTGHQGIVRLLIDKGADINASGGQYGSALLAASFSGNQETVRLLIDKGADINASGGQYGNALEAAVAQGHEELTRWLLTKGVDISRQGGQYGDALQAASCMGHEDLVRLLLAEGAYVNARGGQYGSALLAASMMGHEEIVRLLREAGADDSLQSNDCDAISGEDTSRLSTERTTETMSSITAPWQVAELKSGATAPSTAYTLSVSDGRSLSGQENEYIDDLADMLIHHLGSKEGTLGGTECDILTDLITEFAFRMSYQGDSEEHRNTAWLVCVCRKQIMNKIMQTGRMNTAESVHSVMYISDSSEDGMTVRDDDQIQEMLSKYRLEHLLDRVSDEYNDAEEPWTSGPEVAQRDERIQKHRAILADAQQMTWLRQTMQARSMLDLEGQTDSTRMATDVIALIEQLNKSHGRKIREISRKRKPLAYLITFSLHWSPLQFVESEAYPDLSEKLLERVVTLTGNGSRVQACTAGEYMAQVWPSAGRQLLRLISRIVLAPRSTQHDVLDDGTDITVQLLDETLVVRATGSRLGLAQTAEQLAWIGSAMQSPPENSQAKAHTCTVSRSWSHFMKLREAPSRHSSPIASLHYDLHFTQVRQDTILPSSQNGDCWHGMFYNFVVAEGFPILKRGDDGPGLELSFELLARLIRVQSITVIAGGLFLSTTTGTLMYATKVTEDTEIWWHYMTHEGDDWLSYADAPSEAFLLDSHYGLEEWLVQIKAKNVRHFVGWSQHVENLIGSSKASYNIQSPQYSQAPTELTLENLQVGYSSQVVVQAEISIGKRCRPAIVADTDPGRLLSKRIGKMKRSFVILHDLHHRIAWLTDGASALLHLLRTSLELEKEEFPNLKLHDQQDENLDNAAASLRTLTDQRNWNMKLHTEADPDVDSGKDPDSDSHFDSDSDVATRSHTRHLEPKTRLKCETVKERVESICHLLEKICAKMKAADTNPKYCIDLSVDQYILGYDFMQVAEEDKEIPCRLASFQGPRDQWPQLAKALQAPVLFGHKFGELFQLSTNTSQCKNCFWNTTAPPGSDLLAVSESDLYKLIEKFGQGVDDFEIGNCTEESVALCHDIHWRNPGSALRGCLCPDRTSLNEHRSLRSMIPTDRPRNIFQTLEKKTRSSEKAKGKPPAAHQAGQGTRGAPPKPARKGALLFGPKMTRRQYLGRIFGQRMSATSNNGTPTESMTVCVASAAATMDVTPMDVDPSLASSYCPSSTIPTTSTFSLPYQEAAISPRQRAAVADPSTEPYDDTESQPTRSKRFRQKVTESFRMV